MRITKSKKGIIIEANEAEALLIVSALEIINPEDSGIERAAREMADELTGFLKAEKEDYSL